MRKMTTGAEMAFALSFLLPLTAAALDASAISLPKNYSNGKVCRSLLGEPHVHAAKGVHADKAAAQSKAVKDWTWFTSLEYGKRWGNWRLAVGHMMTCLHDNDAGVWRCRAEAQPCRI